MKQKAKKIILFLVLGVQLFSLCACSMTDTSIDEMMRPPQLSASRQQVQKAIEGILGLSYQLISPSSGEHRSGIILRDLDGDKQAEAICFCTIGDVKLLDVLVLHKEGEGWVQSGRFSSDATDVERVEFADLDGDGREELCVGWSYLTGSEKSMELLQLTEKNLVSRHKQLYARFAVTGDKIIVIDSNFTASLMGLKNKKTVFLSSVPVDSRITAYLSLLVSKTTAGAPALYLDAQLEDGSYHTEVLVVSGEKYLENKLLTEEKLRLSRPYALRCTDINGDGFPEIPTTRPMENGDAAAYYTDWVSFDGKALSTPLVTYTAPGEQFYVAYPAAWQGKLFVKQDAKMQRLFHFVDKKGEIFYSLRAFTVSEFDRISPSEGWISLHEGTDKVLAYKIVTAPDEALAVSTADWAKMLVTY